MAMKAKKDWDVEVAETRPPIGGLRIAKVTYEHASLYADNGGMSIGQLIDQHISDVLAEGSSVSEVALFFETPEQQEALRRMYRG